jgi:hypothetical protein
MGVDLIPVPSQIETNNDQVTIQDSYLNRIITKYFKEFSADLNIQSIGIVGFCTAM